MISDWVWIATIIISTILILRYGLQETGDSFAERLKGWGLLTLTIFIFLCWIDSLGNSTGSSYKSSGFRVGAICNDGWRSNATGQGACSHHGGVDYWLYSND